MRVGKVFKMGKEENIEGQAWRIKEEENLGGQVFEMLGHPGG